MKRLLRLLVVALLLPLSAAWAQERTVTGRVTSAEDGSPLPGVNVVIKGTTVGTATDLDGRYSISVSQGAVLVYSFIGLKSQEVAVGERASVDVSLALDATQLSEVVVTGYGLQSRAEVTGAITSVGYKEFQDMPLRNIDQALQGRSAGVNIVQSSGTPGSGISVNIRGTGSLGSSSQPLFVIDGVPINTGSYTAIGTGGQLTNALSDLNPNDIESFEILKDAAASAIYGSRAANGVVIITTKQGRAGRTKVDFNFYTGIEQRQNDPVKKINGQQASELMLEMVRNRYPLTAFLGGGAQWADHAELTTWLFDGAAGATNTPDGFRAVTNNDGVREASIYRDPSTAPSTDWLDEIFRTGKISQYDLAFSGGTEKSTFRFSTTYFNQEGIMIGSGFERFSARINLANQVTDHFRFGTNVAVSRSVAVRPQNDNNINGVLSTGVLYSSDIPIFRANGTYYKDPGSSTENPIAAGLEPFFESVSSRVIGSTYGEVDIAKGLKFRTELGLDFLLFKDDRFQPTTTNTGAGSNGLGQSSSRTDLNWVWKNNFTYNKDFGSDHRISALVGFEYQQSTFESLFAQASVFPGNTIRRLSAGAVKADASSGGSVWGLESYLGRVNYTFKGKYLLSGSVRVDGSSRFGEDNRYGVFPAGSIGWRLSDEGFMSGVNFLSDLKLRASYGITGNQEIGNFASLPLFSSGANYIGLGGLAPGQLGNPSLTWEEASILNFGADIGLLKDRIFLAVEYYIKDNRELLQNLPLVGSSGFLGVTQNIGSIRNSGVELSITTVNVSKANFRWTSNINLTFNKNEVTKLAGAPFASGFASWVEEGQPLGAFRGFRVDRIIQNETDRQAAIAQGQTAAQLGDILFKDLDGNGSLTSADQEILGSAQPVVFGGFNNTLKYKGFDATIFFRFVSGNKIYNNTRAFSEGMNGVFGQTDGVLNRWTPDNPSTTTPRAVFGDPNNNRRTSDRWLEDGSFLRLNNLQVGYTIPPSVVTRSKVLRSARIYVSSQNLFTWTKYSGFDPEVSTFNITNTAPGTDFLTYPQAKAVSVGVNLGL
jgi:TonB-dependent starch-binding outer membrane protein SusC